MNQASFLLAIGVVACTAVLLLGLAILLIYFLVVKKKNPITYIKTNVKFPANLATTFRKPNNPTVSAENPENEEYIALLKRLHALEEEIAQIKYSITKKPATLREKFQKSSRFLVDHWVFISFIGSVAVLLYIQFVFHVDYFENVRDISIQKKLSEFYRVEGDKLLDVFDFDAAKGAYTKALEIDPNNEIALYRLAVSQVFEPEESQTYTDPYTTDRKLDHLLLQFPNDYHLYLLKAFVYDETRGDIKTAQEWTQKALQKNSDCPLCYIELGVLDQKSNNLVEAAKYYEKVLETDPSNVYALNNMGFMYLLNNDYKNADKYLQSAYYWSPKIYTLMTWGDVALYSKNLEYAKRRYEAALSVLSDASIKSTDHIFGGSVIYNYMPLKIGDVETIKKYEIFSTIDDKKIMCYYNLSFTYALMGNDEKANEYFEKAITLDTLQKYNVFFASKLKSIKNLISTSPASTDWINSHISELDRSQ